MSDQQQQPGGGGGAGGRHHRRSQQQTAFTASNGNALEDESSSAQQQQHQQWHRLSRKSSHVSSLRRRSIAPGSPGAARRAQADREFRQKSLTSSNMSENELREMRETFEAFDEDKSGTIDVDELRQIMKHLGHNISVKDTAVLLQQVSNDLTREGLVFDELVNLLMLFKETAQYKLLEHDSGGNEEDNDDDSFGGKNARAVSGSAVFGAYGTFRSGSISGGGSSGGGRGAGGGGAGLTVTASSFGGTEVEMQHVRSEDSMGAGDGSNTLLEQSGRESSGTSGQQQQQQRRGSMSTIGQDDDEASSNCCWYTHVLPYLNRYRASDSTPVTLWHLIMLVWAAYFWFVPLLIDTNNSEEWLNTVVLATVVPTAVGTVFLVLDIIVSLYLVNEPEELLEWNIDKHYAKKWMWADLISLIPWEWILRPDAVNPDMSQIICRVFIHLRLLKLVVAASNYHQPSHVVRSSRVYIFVHAFFIPVWKSSILFVCMVHLLAVIWVGASPNQTYTNAMLFAAYTVSGVGYGIVDFVTTPAQRLLASAYCLLSPINVSIVVGSTITLLSQSNVAISNRHSVVEGLRICEMSGYNQAITSDMLGYREHLNQVSVGSAHSAVTECLPDELKRNITLFVKTRLIQNSGIFVMAHRTTQVALAQALEDIVLRPGQVLCYVGETVSDMYMISHGKVAMISDEGQIAEFIYGGGCVNDIGLVRGHVKQNRTARAVTHCDVFVLTRPVFASVCKKFPVFGKAVLEVRSNLKQVEAIRKAQTKRDNKMRQREEQRAAAAAAAGRVMSMSPRNATSSAAPAAATSGSGSFRLNPLAGRPPAAAAAAAAAAAPSAAAATAPAICTTGPSGDFTAREGGGRTAAATVIANSNVGGGGGDDDDHDATKKAQQQQETRLQEQPQSPQLPVDAVVVQIGGISAAVTSVEDDVLSGGEGARTAPSALHQRQQTNDSAAAAAAAAGDDDDDDCGDVAAPISPPFSSPTGAEFVPLAAVRASPTAAEDAGDGVGGGGGTNQGQNGPQQEQQAAAAAAALAPPPQVAAVNVEAAQHIGNTYVDSMMGALARNHNISFSLLALRREQAKRVSGASGQAAGAMLMGGGGGGAAAVWSEAAEESGMTPTNTRTDSVASSVMSAAAAANRVKASGDVGVLGGAVVTSSASGSQNQHQSGDAWDSNAFRGSQPHLSDFMEGGGGGSADAGSFLLGQHVGDSDRSSDEYSSSSEESDTALSHRSAMLELLNETSDDDQLDLTAITSTGLQAAVVEKVELAACDRELLRIEKLLLLLEKKLRISGMNAITGNFAGSAGTLLTAHGSHHITSNRTSRHSMNSGGTDDRSAGTGGGGGGGPGGGSMRGIAYPFGAGSNPLAEDLMNEQLNAGGDTPSRDI